MAMLFYCFGRLVFQLKPMELISFKDPQSKDLIGSNTLWRVGADVVLVLGNSFFHHVLSRYSDGVNLLPPLVV